MPNAGVLPYQSLTIQVAVSPGFTTQQASARLKIWETRLAEQGGSLLRPAAGAAARASSSKGGQAGAPTHCLVGDEPNAAATAAAAAAALGSKQCHIVHYSWLESSLRKKRRLCEADFAPDALAEAAAASSASLQSVAQQHKAAGGAAGAATGAAGTAGATAAAGPSQAAVSRASVAAASAAAAGAPPPLRQLAVRSSRLTAGDVQQLLLHLLAGRSRPHWLSIHVRLGCACSWLCGLVRFTRRESLSCGAGCAQLDSLVFHSLLACCPQGRPSSVVLVELPGIDYQAVRWEQPPALPQLQAAAKQRVEVQAVSAAEVPTQTTVALLSVANPGGRGGAGKKRKQPEPSSSRAGAAAAGVAGSTAAAANGAEGSGAATDAAAAGAAEQPHTAAQLAFPPEFYCCTPRQMRQLSYPAGCPEAATAADSSANDVNDGDSSNAAVPQLPPGWVSTTQQDDAGGSLA